jgi:hypothetical protein
MGLQNTRQGRVRETAEAVSRSIGRAMFENGDYVKAFSSAAIVPSPLSQIPPAECSERGANPF